jgi:hypothetical protein
MRKPPSRTIAILRAGPPNITALQDLMRQWSALLKPYVGMGRQHGI